MLWDNYRFIYGVYYDDTFYVIRVRPEEKFNYGAGWRVLSTGGLPARWYRLQHLPKHCQLWTGERLW